MLIYKSGYLTVNFLEVQYLMHLQWEEPASLLDAQGVYSEAVNFFNRRIHRRARLFLLDFRAIENRVDSQFFEWFKTYILPKILSLKATKIALISTETSSIDSIKHIKVNNITLELKTFNDVSEATKWLLNNAQRKQLGKSSHHHH